LALKGCIVTLEALGCQHEIAGKILAQGGDYLLPVKGHQETTEECLREFFDEAERNGFGRLPVSRYETLEKDQGRIETRTAIGVNDLDWLDAAVRQRWPKLAGVGLLRRPREINGKTATEHAFHIGSKGIVDAGTFAVAARRH
jgi:predicted transposase YbfD/YdcC